MIRMTTKNRAFTLGPLLAAGLLVAELGCDYRDLSVIGGGPAADPTGLGSICMLADDGTPTNISVDTESASCSSRLCLRPNQEKTTDTAALCTQFCDSDDDCQGGAARDPQNAMDFRCQTGFTCRAIVPNLSSAGALAGRKVCACEDFFVGPATTPAGCP